MCYRRHNMPNGSKPQTKHQFFPFIYILKHPPINITPKLLVILVEVKVIIIKVSKTLSLSKTNLIISTSPLLTLLNNPLH